MTAVKIRNLLNETSITMYHNAANNAPQVPGAFSLQFLQHCPLPPPPIATHRSVLLDLLVVGDDLADAINKATLVIGDEAHEYFLLGRVEQHQHSHLTGRRCVGKVYAASLWGGSQD